MTKASKLIKRYNQREGGLCFADINEAMQQHAIDFAEWCNASGWLFDTSLWGNENTKDDDGYTELRSSEELYTLFNNQPAQQ